MRRVPWILIAGALTTIAIVAGIEIAFDREPVGIIVAILAWSGVIGPAPGSLLRERRPKDASTERAGISRAGDVRVAVIFTFLNGGLALLLAAGWRTGLHGEPADAVLAWIGAGMLAAGALTLAVMVFVRRRSARYRS